MPDLPTFQTVTLSRGRHADPSEGVCVAELVSMLAGEPFSDRPPTACPAVMSFLRGYNDAIDDRRRQDLFAVAASLVGSHAGPEETARRAARCVAWARRWRRLGAFGPRVGEEADTTRCESAGHHVGRIARRRPEVHAATIDFVVSLLTEQPAETVGPVPSKSAEAVAAAPPAPTT